MSVTPARNQGLYMNYPALMSVPLLPAVVLQVVFAASLAACAGAPTQEMSDARQAVQAAVDSNAAEYVPQLLSNATALLREAEQQLDRTAFKKARRKATAAKQEALKAHRLARVLAGAKAVIRDADSRGALWLDTEALFQDARRAGNLGDSRACISLAGRAKRQAQLALRQFFYQQSKLLLAEVKAGEESLTPEREAVLQRAEEDFAAERYEEAYTLIRPLAGRVRGW
jgi:hypothetical protein